MGDVRRPGGRITFIDDDYVFVDCLRQLFARLDPPLAVSHRTDAGGIGDYCERTQPDVVVLDPEKLDDAVDTVVKIRMASSNTCVLVLTKSTDSAVAARLAQSGALGWVGRDEHVGDLIDAIRAVMLGAAHYPPRHLGPVMQMLGQCVRASRFDYPSRPGYVLTKREQQVLARLLSGANARQVAHDLRLSANTVRSHRRRIGAKLGVEL